MYKEEKVFDTDVLKKGVFLKITDQQGHEEVSIIIESTMMELTVIRKEEMKGSTIRLVDVQSGKYQLELIEREEARLFMPK